MNTRLIDTRFIETRFIDDEQLGSALDGAGVPAAPESEPEVPAGAPGRSADVPAAAQPSGENHGGRVFASPIVRRLARERGLDLGELRGTGPDGRIVRRDIDALPARVASPWATAGGYTDLPLTAMRRAIARRLTESKTTVPHYYLTAHCRADRLVALRAEVNAAVDHKVSVNDFVLKAVAGALRRVPAANAIWGDDHIRRFDRVDVGVAVAVEGGLLTPVLRSVDTATISQVASSVADLAERARTGRLRQHELEGGSFAVSNLGRYGVDEFSAILNPPQSGILAVGSIKERAVVDDGQLAVGAVMTVTLSVDHRVIDGAVAAEWLAAFVGLIENPVGILV